MSIFRKISAKSFYAGMRQCFGRFEMENSKKDILQNSSGNSFLYIYRSHDRFVGENWLSRACVAGTTRCRIAFYNLSKVERVILKFLL